MDETENQESTPDNSGEGFQSETNKKVEELNADTERINKAIAENENAKARQRLGGVAEAGTETKSKYSEEEQASRKRIKSVGEAVGASWAKNYE